jgi:rhodanese-related sulfurtransferase
MRNTMNRKNVLKRRVGVYFAVVVSAAFILALAPGGGGAVANEKSVLETVTPEEALSLIEQNGDGSGFAILDVRTPDEFNEGHIANAVNIDYYSDGFRENLDRLDKGKTYLLYCRSGSRSGKALPLMGELGFERVYNMGGGFVQWEKKGFPVAK